MEKVEGQEISLEAALVSSDALIKQFNLFRKLMLQNDVVTPFPEGITQSEDYPSFLGLSLMDHDVGNLKVLFEFYTSVQKSIIDGKKDDIRHAPTNEYYFYIMKI